MLAAESWWVDGAGSVEWREWGDDCVVYHGNAAKTHLLSASAGAVLRALLSQRGPVPVGALFNRLLGSVDGQPTEPMSGDEDQALNAILSDFERIGLARRVVS